MANCELCGEPMSEAESVFKFHGYSGPCPKPPLPKTMTINTAEIEARLAKATPGPWEIMPFGVVRLIRSRSTTVASVKSGPEHKHDVDFIAHSPQDVADLLSALDTLTREREAEMLALAEYIFAWPFETAAEAITSFNAQVNP